MARAPDPRIEKAKAMYLEGMKLVEIASRLNRKRTIASTCSYALFSAIIVSHDTESKKLST